MKKLKELRAKQTSLKPDNWGGLSSNHHDAEQYHKKEMSRHSGERASEGPGGYRHQHAFKMHKLAAKFHNQAKINADDMSNKMNKDDHDSYKYNSKKAKDYTKAAREAGADADNRQKRFVRTDESINEAKTPYQSADHVKQLPHTNEFEGNDHLGPNGKHSKKSPNLTMKQRMAHHDTSAEHDQAARHHEEMATRARGSKSGGVSLRYAHTKAAEYHRMAADHHLNSMYDDATHHDVHMAHHMGNAANSFSKHIQTKYIKKKMKDESVNEAVQYKVDVEGLPPTFMTGKSPAEIMAKLRKIVKQPSMIKSVERHTDAEVKKAFRNKAQGREIDEAGTPERLAMIRKAGEKINKEKKKAERDAKRAIAKDKDLMGEAVTYHGNPNKDDDARNAARRRRLAKQDNIMKKRAQDNEKARQALKDPDHDPAWAKSKSKMEASVVPSKDGKKLVPMKKHSAPKSEPVPNDQFGLPRLKKTNEVSMPVKQRAADERARRQNQADNELSKAEKHPLSNIPFTKAKKKADDAGKKFNRNYIGTNPEMGDGGKRAALYKKAGVTPNVKLKNEATYGSQAQRMMSPLQKARQDKEKADRDRHGNLNMMKGRPKKKKLGEISMDLKQRYADKAKSDYGHQKFSADIAKDMGAKDAEKHYRRKQRNRLAGIGRVGLSNEEV